MQREADEARAREQRRSSAHLVRVDSELARASAELRSLRAAAAAALHGHTELADGLSQLRQIWRACEATADERAGLLEPTLAAALLCAIPAGMAARCSPPRADEGEEARGADTLAPSADELARGFEQAGARARDALELCRAEARRFSAQLPIAELMAQREELKLVWRSCLVAHAIHGREKLMRPLPSIRLWVLTHPAVSPQELLDFSRAGTDPTRLFAPASQSGRLLAEEKQRIALYSQLRKLNLVRAASRGQLQHTCCATAESLTAHFLVLIFPIRRMPLLTRSVGLSRLCRCSSMASRRTRGRGGHGAVAENTSSG